MPRGDSSARRTASEVISWNSIRFGSRSFSTSARCQAMASPSLSGSDARMTSRSFFAAERSSLIVLRRVSTTS